MPCCDGTQNGQSFMGFQKFVYQNAEITYLLDSPDLVTRARHFGEILMRYDVRRDTGMWGAVAYYGSVVQRFLDTGSPGDQAERGHAGVLSG